MKIGLTYDLRTEYLRQGYSLEQTAEFDKEDTIDSIEAAIVQLGHTPERIGNVRSLIEAIANKKSWDLVFNIAEGLYGFGREAQVPCILEACGIPYTFSDPLTLCISLHKGIAKQLVRANGIPTADFKIVESENDIEKITIRGILFAKPVAEGTGKGIDEHSKITNKKQLKEICKRLIKKYKQPVVVERYLPGREFTVGIIGTGKNAEAIGTLEIISKRGAQKHAYSYYNKEHCEQVIEYILINDAKAREAERIALKSWRVLGCRDAGRVDLREDKNGQINFIEVNPLAGLHPTHSDLPIICSKKGITYHDLIARIIASATERKTMGIFP